MADIHLDSLVNSHIRNRATAPPRMEQSDLLHNELFDKPTRTAPGIITLGRLAFSPSTLKLPSISNPVLSENDRVTRLLTALNEKQDSKHNVISSNEMNALLDESMAMNAKLDSEILKLLTSAKEFQTNNHSSTAHIFQQQKKKKVTAVMEKHETSFNNTNEKDQPHAPAGRKSIRAVMHDLQKRIINLKSNPV